MTSEKIEQLRLENLHTPVLTKKKLFKKFSYVDEEIIRTTLNECIAENRKQQVNVLTKILIVLFDFICS